MLKSFFVVLFLLVGCQQTALAQMVVMNLGNGQSLKYNVADVSSITFETESEYVDLGLPSGTLWAPMNVGAEGPEDYGYYIAWGETAPKDNYGWAYYKWMNEGKSSYSEINKYTIADKQTGACWYSDGVFKGDGKRVLDALDDAATASLGSDWHMPSVEQFVELKNEAYTTIEWTTLNGVAGCKITSKANGHSIFLPAAGYYNSTSPLSAGERGLYWTRELYKYFSDYAYAFRFSSGEYDCYRDEVRRSGLSVRPVRHKTSGLLNGHEWIDLGLPSGTKWATCNVGASSSEEYGDYFAWGETETKDDYFISYYKYCQGNNHSYTKYCVSSEYGTVDNKTELEPEDDAATVNWGDGWRMPSVEQQSELLDINYTYSMWTTVNGVNGYRITSKINGNSIFLPSAGAYTGFHLIRFGKYMSRSLQTENNICHVLFFLDNEKIKISDNERSTGMSVRAVCK